MAPLYFYREQKEWLIKGSQGINENTMEVLCFLNAAAGTQNIVINPSIPALAESAGLHPKHFYNGLEELVSKDYITWNGNDLEIKYHDKRFAKLGKGYFLVPDVVLTKHFTLGTRLRTKRLAFYFFSFGIAEKNNKRYKNGLDLTKDILIKISGATCPAQLDEFLNEISWLFEVVRKGHLYTIKLNEIYVIVPEKKNFADYVDLAFIKQMLARYKNVKQRSISFWNSLIILYNTYGSKLLHEALEVVNQRLRFDFIANLGGYIRRVIDQTLEETRINTRKKEGYYKHQLNMLWNAM